jgi:hypothetical protein
VDPLDGLAHHLLGQFNVTAGLRGPLAPALLLLRRQRLLATTAISGHFPALGTHVFEPIEWSATVVMVTGCHHIW